MNYKQGDIVWVDAPTYRGPGRVYNHDYNIVLVTINRGGSSYPLRATEAQLTPMFREVPAFDPTLAPEGYVAERADGQYSCDGCAFRFTSPLRCGLNKYPKPCFRENRPDRTEVIFKKKEEK